ncbi:hypothetical protein I305_02471 [Cryptococcus gattii E566]|uniref:Alpha/beta-hydrolase n=2 Tax=Cryptococcus gattii TaxID=37769 RepID=E6RB67_CRYGW|nr:uncharacterized protein CGB_H4460C [Cryptococcus gattii WM276]ADV24077.1 hypothetical protein CNE04520 [Cryptococcus gattii WM276]KIR81404.1 hypothetical protein I306_01639 [Cryptococcus gattii EJB2]KIY34908.1 hypothetical protein I305_02471 [Cryptococcus gattii E566]
MTMTAPFTVTFDAKHGLQLDAYLPSTSDTLNGRPFNVPVVIHYHRGGMLIGSKSDIYPPFMPAYLRSRKILLISPSYRLLFPSSADDMIEDVRSSATLSSIVPRPIGWLNLSGMVSDWLLDFWINGIDVERTMPLDTTVHDMAKADELMKTGGGAVVSEVESVLVNGKATDELGRFNLWIAWQKRGIFLDYVLSEPGLSSRLAQVPYQSRLPMIPKEKRRLLLPITPSTPPTYVLHGKEDRLVPFEESLTLENDMKEKGLSIKIDWVHGADHLLRDQKKGGWNGMVDNWEDIAKRALNWAVDLVK